MIRHPPRSPLFPYPPLSRSKEDRRSETAATVGDKIVVRLEPWESRHVNPEGQIDRKSTRLNSSHSQNSYAVFCLKKKKKTNNTYIVHQRLHSPPNHDTAQRP